MSVWFIISRTNLNSDLCQKFNGFTVKSLPQRGCLFGRVSTRHFQIYPIFFKIRTIILPASPGYTVNFSSPSSASSLFVILPTLYLCRRTFSSLPKFFSQRKKSNLWDLGWSWDEFRFLDNQDLCITFTS